MTTGAWLLLAYAILGGVVWWKLGNLGPLADLNRVGRFVLGVAWLPLLFGFLCLFLLAHLYERSTRGAP